MYRIAVAIASLSFVLVGCQKGTQDSNQNQPKVNPGAGSGAGSGSAHTPARPRMPQVKPPLDLKNPPADALKTPSGLIYKKLVSNDKGVQAHRNDTVLINYTGWRQSTGETFFTNHGRGQPMPLNLATTAPGFTEAMQLMRKGEKAMLWVPPSIGYKGRPSANAETLVYEVEVVEIKPAPPIPEDVASPPATAKSLESGIKYVVLHPGTGKEPAHSYDTVTFNYTAWTKDGRMFDSTEMRKRPASVPPYRQSKAMEEMLTSMVAGERVRYWVDSKDMSTNGRPLPGIDGLVCYEVEILQIEKGHEPPRVPPDVAKPPPNAKKTAKGVFYRVLKASGKKQHPKPTDMVKVNYTGWTTDGRMFDSSVVKGQPAEFSLSGVIAGWTDGIPVMAVGDRVRFWIPEELAYKGAPGRPQGMLVFDVDLLEIKEPPKPPQQGKPQPPPPVPTDVAAPPAGAKKTAKGVFYKVLKKGPGGPHPKATDTVTVHYSGWQTDGHMFDSSVTRGKPAEFSLSGVIAGWTDGLQVMSVGDKYRFWIPQDLAYKGRNPKGMLVFDVELLGIRGQ